MADSSVPQYVTDRAKVTELVARDYDKALALARKIDHPWYRCQSLSTVAEKTSSKEARRNLIEEAFRAAAEQSEPNRVVTVSAWPPQVLAREASLEELETHFKRLNDIIARESHPVRRSDALYMVADLLKDGPRDAFLTAVGMFAGYAHQGHGWKRDRSLRNMAITCWKKGEQSVAQHLVEQIEGAQCKRQALRALK